MKNAPFKVKEVQSDEEDASIFPKTPGTFIVTPIYMVSEKAPEVIIENYKNKKS